jgi:DNA-binding CsgD family transcriptional regulator
MGKIAPVDAFYVGLFHGADLLAIPYTYDEHEYDPPGLLTVGPYGLGAWLLKHKRTYTFAADSGRLLNAGHSYGDTTRRSRDAVTVPFIDRLGVEPRVFGMASMQSYTPNVFGNEAERAFEWLCDCVVGVLRRDHDATNRLRELEGAAGIGPTLPDLIVDLSNKLEEIRSAISQLRAAADNGENVGEHIDELDRLCTRVQHETFAVLTLPTVDAIESLVELTPREREIAELIAERLSNQEIADRLTIAVTTVKTHVARIMRKFDVRQRSEIISKLRPFR